MVIQSTFEIKEKQIIKAVFTEFSNQRAEKAKCVMAKNNDESTASYHYNLISARLYLDARYYQMVNDFRLFKSHTKYSIIKSSREVVIQHKTIKYPALWTIWCAFIHQHRMCINTVWIGTVSYIVNTLIWFQKWNDSCSKYWPSNIFVKSFYTLLRWV